MPTPNPAADDGRAQGLRGLVVDDHPVVAEALVAAIAAMRLFERIEAATSLADACRALEASEPCHLVILDLNLGDTKGRGTLDGLRERFPSVPVLVFSGEGSLESITLAFEGGARGYATKQSPMSVLKGAIQIVLAGGIYVPPEAVQTLGFAPAPSPSSTSPPAPAPVRFSVRQEQVFRLLLQGMPNKVIAARLDMAEGTAKAHLNSVYRMLGVRNRVEAILRARQLGII